MLNDRLGTVRLNVLLNINGRCLPSRPSLQLRPALLKRAPSRCRTFSLPKYVSTVLHCWKKMSLAKPLTLWKLLSHLTGLPLGVAAGPT
jgi:hypothetical protein